MDKKDDNNLKKADDAWPRPACVKEKHLIERKRERERESEGERDYSAKLQETLCHCPELS